MWGSCEPAWLRRKRNTNKCKWTFRLLVLIAWDGWWTRWNQAQDSISIKSYISTTWEQLPSLVWLVTFLNMLNWKSDQLLSCCVDFNHKTVRFATQWRWRIFSACRLKGMAQEVDRLQGAQRLRDTQWTGKEQSYKRTIEQLETKVGYLYTI